MKVPILLPNIFDYPFTYNTDLELKVGDYVSVPFGKSELTGVVWNEFEKSSNKKYYLKKVTKKFNSPNLNIKTLNFLNWFANYNLVPKGLTIKLHLIGGQIAENLDKKYYKFYNNFSNPKKYILSTEQSNSLKEMSKNQNNFNVHLLQGTTGSGKTIVYFNLIKKIIKKRKQGLILLPEIGLTNEFEKKFKDFFGFEPAIWHSGISKNKKKIIWSGLASGKINIVIGARSALFLPFKKLGIIIVDEEHDQSYKQDEGIIYNARDMAIARAKFENIPINLVTAIPSIETYENVKKQKYFHSRLINRFKNADLPIHQIIDLKKYKLEKQSWISSKTVEKVQSHLERGDQILFFLNRRGFSPFVLCKSCMKIFSCPNCSINLVYHKKSDHLLCHYCSFKSNLKKNCEGKDKCEYIFSGPGVEKISEEIKRIFPSYKSLIFSSDTMNKKYSKDYLQKILNNEINIIIGTQLISKGFHFPNLNCIVVLDIDLSRLGHDLRGAEKSIQLYHQLSGRAGREGKPANVYFQTHNLKSDLIKKIIDQDPLKFLDDELTLRKKNSLPPYERFISLIVSANDEKKLEEQSFRLKEKLMLELDAKILGPVNAPIYKIKKKFRNRLLIRSKKNPAIQKKLSLILKSFNLSSGIKLTVDVDPINFN